VLYQLSYSPDLQNRIMPDHDDVRQVLNLPSQDC